VDNENIVHDPVPIPVPITQEVPTILEQVHTITSISEVKSSPERIRDYSKEFWTPIDIEISSDPTVTLCKLDFKTYSESPHDTPMFKDLVDKSKCVGKNRRTPTLSVLMKEMATDPTPPIPPTGFVFHEGRVGSTLVANLLGSNPDAMVFSESAPPATAMLHCNRCTRERKVSLFRDVITLMGRSPIHKYMFFKFQSITATQMEIALEAFPDTAWSFIYRDPVQTMMSQVDPHKGANGPCLRSKRYQPKEVRSYVQYSSYV